MDPMGILIKWGPQHLAKGVERGLEELDKIIVGWPVQPSLVGNLAFTGLGALGGFLAPAPYDEILAIWGGHHSTTLWEYAEAAMAPPAARRAALTYIPTTGQYVPTRPGLGVAVGTRPRTRAVKARVDVGPYAGGLTAPKFIPGALRPKFQLGS